MPAKSTTGIPPQISDEAVSAKTGKTWPEWFKLLDKEGAKKLSHKEIVAIVHGKFGLGPWWRQMVTVTYEQARGLRDKHEKPEGYEISISRTIGASITKCYQAWANENLRAEIIPDTIVVVRKATLNKCLRMTWPDKKTSVEVSFHEKGEAKCQVVVQHRKIRSAATAAKMKSFWGKTLDRAKDILEAS